jgi:hypothetical protein
MFFSDIEHEVVPVTFGHCVTLTYNLYFDDNNPSAKDLVSELPSAPQEEDERTFRSAFEALLKNPKFLPDGGTLGFGLRHVYQVEETINHVYSLLKGSDASVYQNLRALGFEPVLYLHYEQWDYNFQAVLTDSVPFMCESEVERVDTMLAQSNGICVPRGHQGVKWVTPLTTINRKKSHLAYGNEAALDMEYGDICLLVRIGKAGERMAYQTAAQVKELEEKKRPYY